MRRWVVGFMAGVSVGLLGATVLHGWASESPKPPHVVMVTSFKPEPAWTPANAEAGIRKLQQEYDEKAIPGFVRKQFVGSFDRNEYGGYYEFESEEALKAFLAAYPPAPNRTVKTYQLLATWEPKKDKPTP
ncbi:hypothetical protein FJZ36_01525 [Candidatus Poribacteria bacterium]|nr:hypothetical protein [Candidatus Poribacteria bacterium]